MFWHWERIFFNLSGCRFHHNIYICQDNRKHNDQNSKEQNKISFALWVLFVFIINCCSQLLALSRRSLSQRTLTMFVGVINTTQHTDNGVPQLPQTQSSFDQRTLYIMIVCTVLQGAFKRRVLHAFTYMTNSQTSGRALSYFSLPNAKSVSLQHKHSLLHLLYNSLFIVFIYGVHLHSVIM